VVGRERDPRVIALYSRHVSVHPVDVENSVSREVESIRVRNDTALAARDGDPGSSHGVRGLIDLEASSLIKDLTKEELTRDLGKAGLETLSIVLYQGPISRREIDYVRGVNSNFILRNLLVRGLVEKIENPKDQRSFLYRPSFDLLSYLGISRTDDLPEYANVKKELEVFAAAPVAPEQVNHELIDSESEEQNDE
jgi:hypothetical protein